MKTIWINAGELSGDMQAAALLTALRERDPGLAAIGMGGPNLARATTSSRRKYGRGARGASASSSATSNGCSASCPLSPLSTPNTAYRLIILAIRSSIW